MTPSGRHLVSAEFPGDIEYIPEIRRFISNIIGQNDFSRRFTFRTEIIIDELCNNAIRFGKPKPGEFIRVACEIGEQEICIDIVNPAAEPADIKRLRDAIETAGIDPLDESAELTTSLIPQGRGIRIVKILSNGISVFESDTTTVRILKRRAVDE